MALRQGTRRDGEGGSGDKMSTLALVTGANGFIGSNLVRGLVERGYRVRSMVLKGTSEEFLDGVDTEKVYADITEPATLKPVMKGVEIVFHLAALASDWGPRKLFMRLNYDGVLNVLDSAYRAGVRRVVHVSSLAVHKYKPTCGGGEDTPLDSKLNEYCITKRLGEESARRFGMEHDIEVTIIRPGIMPFGPRDTTSFVPLANALERGIFQFVDGGRARICTAYIENLVEGMILAGEKPQGADETFIIADDEPRSWKEIIYAFCDALGVKKPMFSVPSWSLYPIASAMMGIWKILPLAGSPPLTLYRIRVSSCDLFFSNAKAKRVLGYQPLVSFEEGIRRTVEWYNQYKKRR